MTARDIRAHLRQMYDVDVSPDLISRVTDGVLEELAEWQSRPLDAVYPVIFTGALMVKIRDGVVSNRPVYLAIGIDCEGARQVLGLWVGPSTGESAKPDGPGSTVRGTRRDSDRNNSRIDSADHCSLRSPAVCPAWRGVPAPQVGQDPGHVSSGRSLAERQFRSDLVWRPSQLL
jgi:Transposase, Mutator family